jgi:hypothetical protein
MVGRKLETHLKNLILENGSCIYLQILMEHAPSNMAQKLRLVNGMIKICQVKYFISNLQIVVENDDGALLDRLSPWATYVVKPPVNEGCAYQQVVWHPPQACLGKKNVFFVDNSLRHGIVL